MDQLKSAGSLAETVHPVVEDVGKVEVVDDPKEEEKGGGTVEKVEEASTAKWAVGDLCVAQWREDGVWYNSRILEITKDEVRVLFVDYGNEDFTTLVELKPAGSLDDLEATADDAEKSSSSKRN